MQDKSWGSKIYKTEHSGKREENGQGQNIGKQLAGRRKRKSQPKCHQIKLSKNRQCCRTNGGICKRKQKLMVPNNTGQAKQIMLNCRLPMLGDLQKYHFARLISES